MSERTISVDYMARVEGEGALKVKIHDRTVEDVQLRIFEPPRFFEALLKGRSYQEAPDITSRICGICPVAYQMSACHAMEKLLGLRVNGQRRALRRLLYCGEWISSHSLHIYLLHAPDFLGYPDAIRLAKNHPQAVANGLKLKKAGNSIMSLLGGREIHPINVRVGGFYRVPSVDELAGLRPQVEEALMLAEQTVRFVSGFTFPDEEEDYEMVALRNAAEYPMNEGILVSTRGLRIPQEDFEREFEEVQVPYGNSLHCVHRGGGSYLVGPLARYALNHDMLSPMASSLAREADLGPVVMNPFKSIIVRAIEVVYACEEALRIIDSYKPPSEPFVPPPDRIEGGTGVGITEAPRGILYHKYVVAAGGLIEKANIIPPTTQNQKRIEDDLRHVVERSLDLDDMRLTNLCERAIRNHDPCISCATHFLRMDLERV